MIVIFTGLPGSGKSYKLARTIVEVLYRNRKYYAAQLQRFEKHPEAFVPEGQMLPVAPRMRMLYTNLKLSPDVEREFEGQFAYWSELRQLTPLRDCDVVIDEVSVYFDARLWETLGIEMRRWLNQHRKLGVEIYGTSQDFAQVDKAFRRITSELIYLTKLVGSRDISATRPPPRLVWGVVLVRALDPTTYDEEKSKFGSAGLPHFMWIGRKGTQIFDTQAEVALSSALPLRHILAVCERQDCGFKRTRHI